MAEDYKRRCEWKNRRSWSEDQGALHTYKTGGSPGRGETEKILVFFFFFCRRPYICFRKVFLPPVHPSRFRKHSFCLQKQKCFIIKGLLLTQNLIVNHTVSCFCQIWFCQHFKPFCQTVSSTTNVWRDAHAAG